VELINISGKVLLTQDLTETLNTLAIDHLKAGVYFLRASGPAGTNIKRFIKGK
jgi:hypothetical protein